jgi:2-amino-4-hydroxy-6-hydroxymethyldihydropteridine diphosphokinase
MTPVAIGLGSNVGGRLEHLQKGLMALADAVSVRRWSSVWESVPMYYVSQPAFLNACCTGETELESADLLTLLQNIERAEGRRRGGPRFGPRELDLDLLLYGNRVLDRPDLQVPHRGMCERAFVLVPLAEVAGGWNVPGTDRTVRQLAAGMSISGLRRHASAAELSPGVIAGR